MRLGRKKGNIDILLDQSGPTYVPGQFISGKVRSSLRKTKKVKRVFVVFQGKARSSIEENNASPNGTRISFFEEDNDLFHFEHTFLEGPFEMQSGTIEWPFSFTFPETSDYSRSPSTKPRKDGGYEFNPNPQPLPPTDYTQGSASGGGYARVSYTLTATMLLSGFASTPLQSEVQLRLVPSSRPLLTQPIAIESEVIRKKRGNSSVQSMSHIFTRDPTLNMPLSARLYVPRSATTVQPLSLAISLGCDDHSHTNIEIPSLIVDRVVVRLEKYTRWRVRKLGLRKDTSYDRDSSSTTKLSAYQLPCGKTLLVDSTPIQVTDPFRLVDLPIKAKARRIANASSSSAISSSFSTYNIVVKHTLKIDVTLKREETGRHFKFKWTVPFTILPPENPKALQSTGNLGQSSPAAASQLTASLALPLPAQGSNLVAVV